MSLHEEVFRRSANLTDANAPGSRKDGEPAPDRAYLLLGAPTEKYPHGLMFGAIHLGKRYVSYHLMCVYLAPDLFGAMSPELRRRMQGKACFTFTKVDEALCDELSAVTARGPVTCMPPRAGSQRLPREGSRLPGGGSRLPSEDHPHRQGSPSP